MKIIENAKKTIMKAIFDSLAQDSVEVTDDGLTSSAKTAALCRRMAAEGCILLKNDDEVLPIKKGEKIAVFGRCQNDYFYVGYGSGGDVNPPYKISPMKAFEETDVLVEEHMAEIYRQWSKDNPPFDGYWGNWPMNYDEMPLDESDVKVASENSEKAMVFIGRSSGEDREAKVEKGSWYLTDEEERMLSIIGKYFDKVCVILNCGSIFDMTWIDKFNPSAVLLAWQGGQESGRGLVDILIGKTNPSGKLTDTVASLEKYPSTENFGKRKESIYSEDIYVGYRYFETFAPEHVRYPFGYGLSYTTFQISSDRPLMQDGIVSINVKVKNTGSRAGREVVQVYGKAPQGWLGKPERVLCAFKKTSLIESGEEESLCLIFNIEEMASYDDTGVSGNKNCFILEEGQYQFFVGNDVRSAKQAGEIQIDKQVVRKTLEACPPEKSFNRIVRKNGVLMYEKTPVGTRNLKERILRTIPMPMAKTGDLGYKLADVKTGRVTMEEFVAQLSTEELENLSRGDINGMNSSYGPKGNAAVFGATSDALVAKGIPSISTNDGPSGARLAAHATLFPIGATLASSFDLELIEELAAELGQEVKERKSHVLLAPGMNIHRHPLCGRNFEYFSEDPLVSGLVGAAYVRGVQKAGTSAVPKHFACNNQETGRNVNDAVVSQRALREIYLKGFEICVRESKPDFIMNSYNKINGVYTYNNYDLNTVILRNEMGFEGIIMTDWWTKNASSPEFKNLTNHAYRVRSGNNLFMPGSSKIPSKKPKTDGSIEKSLKADDGLSLGELQRNAKQILTYCLRHI